MKPNFSIVLIARNESKTLPRLIESLKEFQERGGEIILVDTGSTDGTPDIARELGCKVNEAGTRFLHTMDEHTANHINALFIEGGDSPIVVAGDTNFDYSAARNYAAALAENDMIATPDCDEIYTKLDLDKICQAITDGVEQLEYNFVFSHDVEGNEVVKFLHCKFYDRRKLHWTGIIHEILTGNANRQFFQEDVIKLEHWQNVETNRGHYLKGLALSCLLEPDNDRNAHYFGRELLYTGRYASAIKQLERHVAMDRWPAERAESLIFIGDCYLNITS